MAVLSVFSQTKGLGPLGVKKIAFLTAPMAQQAISHYKVALSSYLITKHKLTIPTFRVL